MTCILTLRLDDTSQAHFEALRQQHYPAGLNRIRAHLTLFHTLPDSPETASAIAAATKAQSKIHLTVTGLRSLGKGVAYTLVSPSLLALHRTLATTFADHLTAQDRQRFMPHVVVQNKATSEQARALLTKLQSDFVAFEVQGRGLDLWNYLGGPWQHKASFDFTGTSREH